MRLLFTVLQLWRSENVLQEKQMLQKDWTLLSHAVSTIVTWPGFWVLETGDLFIALDVIEIFVTAMVILFKLQQTHLCLEATRVHFTSTTLRENKQVISFVATRLCLMELYAS